MKIEQMLNSVKRHLDKEGNLDNYSKEILKAMAKVDRKNFISEDFKEQAYIDNALPIEKNQTISQPSTVAKMLQLLKLKKGDNVLEIGTGSGWNVALISYLVGNNGKVLSLEIIKDLKELAEKRVNNLGIKNIKIENKDFRKISEKFDKIIFTAGILSEHEQLIENYALKHLNQNGILISPFRNGPIIIFEKDFKGKISKNYTKDNYVFVPLILE